MFAAKELCRHMVGPKLYNWNALRRLARYLGAHPRLVHFYPFQEEQHIDAFVDTDFAGCLLTRRSTSGGCLRIGSHTIKGWSNTQKTVALSSGEAELMGILRGTSEALGLQSLATDLGMSLPIRVHADSSAAIGICMRTGIGKVRHLATGQLWVQERLRAGAFKLFKIPGQDNPGDIFTKHVARELIVRHTENMGLAFMGGRAASAPHVTAGRGA